MKYFKFFMATIVTWVQDGSGNYQVSSPEHLKQIMHQGALYTDAGAFPTDYFATGTNYIQTADIDLLGDSTDIVPIGSSPIFFNGSYDGGEFKISNWSYIDPNFSTSNNCLFEVGLFGRCSGSTLKNIRLSGVWELQGYSLYAGFLAGFPRSCEIWNIECDFEEGSLIDTNQFSSATNVLGSVCGNCFNSIIVNNITVRGSVDFRPGTHTAFQVGGMFGRIDTDQTPSLMQNLATFPSGINGQIVGGIVGFADLDVNARPRSFVNAMIGDLNGTTFVGGIFGQFVASASNFSNSCHEMINSMTGNITNSTDGETGGIVGLLDSGGNNSYLFNYMTGNISAAGTTYVGGLVGRGGTRDPGTVFFSMNAMNGNVHNAFVGDAGTIAFTCRLDSNFGLTFSSATGLTFSSIQSVLNSAEFPDLPYVLLSEVGPDGITHEFDFVFGNLSGSSNTSYNVYTHCIIHKGDIRGPLRIDFDVSETNTVDYTTFVNISTEDVLQNALTILSIGIVFPLVAQGRSINIPVEIAAVAGATRYEITYEGPAGGEIVAFSGGTALQYNILGVEPETQYTIRLYADTGSGYELVDEVVTTTLPNVATNYQKEDFLEDGVIVLNSLPETTIQNITGLINDILDTGDIVNVSVDTKPEVITSFINLGDSLSIREVNGLLLPFEVTSGAGQDVDVVLSDETTTVPISYDDTVNTITVAGVVYSPGDTFILDGKKITVFDF